MSLTGIAIPSPEKYKEYIVQNIFNLTINLDYKDPIEIWEVGEELSSESRSILSVFSNVVFKNTTDFDDRIEHWRGFQAKAPVLKYSKLNHIIICDADVTILKNPSIIQASEEYAKTGSYMFRDLELWKFNLSLTNFNINNQNENYTDKFTSFYYYDIRKKFVMSLVPNKLDFFPKEWSYLYYDGYAGYPVAEALVESGVFFVNREKNNDVINTFYELNDNWKENYKYVHGDKELVWLSFLKNNKPFSLNPEYPQHNGSLIQTYKNKPFYSQKYICV